MTSLKSTLTLNTVFTPSGKVTVVPYGVSGKSKRVKKIMTTIGNIGGSKLMPAKTKKQLRAEQDGQDFSDRLAKDYNSQDSKGMFNLIAGQPGSGKTSGINKYGIRRLIKEGVRTFVLTVPKNDLNSQTTSDIQAELNSMIEFLRPSLPNIEIMPPLSGDQFKSYGLMKAGAVGNTSRDTVYIIVETINWVHSNKNLFITGPLSPVNTGTKGIILPDEGHIGLGITTKEDGQATTGVGSDKSGEWAKTILEIMNSESNLWRVYVSTASPTPAQQGYSKRSLSKTRLFIDMDKEYRTKSDYKAVNIIPFPFDDGKSLHDNMLDMLDLHYGIMRIDQEERKFRWDSMGSIGQQWLAKHGSSSDHMNGFKSSTMPDYFKNYCAPSGIAQSGASNAKNGITLDDVVQHHASSNVPDLKLAVTYLDRHTADVTSFDDAGGVANNIKMNPEISWSWVTYQKALLGNNVPQLNHFAILRKPSQDVNSGGLHNYTGRITRLVAGGCCDSDEFEEILWNDTTISNDIKIHIMEYFVLMNTAHVIVPANVRLLSGDSEIRDSAGNSKPFMSHSVATKLLENCYEAKFFRNRMLSRLEKNNDVVYLTSHIARAEIEKGLMCDGCVKNSSTGLPECLMTWWRNERRDHPEKSIEDIYLGYRSSLHVHHVDLDKTNGDSDNGRTLCPNYHGYVHQEEGVGSYTIGENVKVAGRIKTLTKQKKLAISGIKSKK